MRHIWLIVVAFGLISACSRNSPYYIENGNRLLEAGKSADAVIQYRKALQKDPKSGEAYYRLGLAELRQGNAIEAFDALDHAVQLSPANEEAAARLADLNLAGYLSDPQRATRFYERVGKLAAGLLEKNPNSVHGLRLKGAIALVDRKPSQAIEFYRRAHQLDPMNRDVVEGLVQALFQDNQPSEGEQLAEAFLKTDPKAGSIYDVLYLRYLATNRAAEAEGILRSKVNNNPLNSEYRLQLARFYAPANKTQMNVALQYMLDRPKEFPEARLQVGDFYNSVGNLEEALRQFQEGAQTHPGDRIVYQKRMADALLTLGKREEAAKVVEQILKDHPKDTEALTARAALLLDGGKQEDVGVAITELQALVKLNADDVIARFQLGRAYLAKGALQEGRAELSESARRRRDYVPPRLVLAELGMSQQRPQETLQMTEEILALNPQMPRAQLLHAGALAALGRQGEARTALTNLVNEFPESEQARVQLGILAIRDKRFKEAEDIFRKLQPTGHADPLAAAGLAETYSAQKQFDKSIQFLEEELKKSRDSMVIGNLLAFTALRAGNYDAAIEAYRKLLETHPQEGSLCFSLGQIYFAKGEYGQAVTTLERAKTLLPQDARVDTLLAAALRQTGRGDDLKVHFENALRLQPNNPVALNNMAFYLAESGGDLDEALKLARRAVEIKRDDPNFSDTLGWVYTKKNMNDAAAQIFTHLVEKQPNNPTVRYHLGVALLGKGDEAGARLAFRAALSQAPPKDEAQKIKELLAKLE